MGDTINSHNIKMTRLVGIFMLFFCVFTFVSCLSYNSADASFNVATDEKVRNIFSIPGAYISDIFMQSFGLISFPIAVIIGVWGFLFFAYDKIFLFWLRIPAFVCTIICACAFLELFASHRDFYYEFIPGGYVGYWFYSKYIVKTLLGKIGAGFGFFIILTISLYLSLGITAGNYKNIVYNLQNIARFPLIIFHPFHMMMRFLKSIIVYSDSGKKSAKKPGTISLITRLMRQLLRVSLSKKARKTFKTRRNTAKVSASMITQPKIGLIEKEFDIPNFSPGEKKQDAKHLVNMDAKYSPPLYDLLQVPKVQKISQIDKQNTSDNLLQTLLDFGVVGEICGISTGPVVSLFEFRPKAGTKSSRVIGLADDIARTMKTTSARISVIQGKDALGIELPNKTRNTIYLRDLLESSEFQNSDAMLPMTLGCDISGRPIVVDMAKMPHLLIAGTTGSGKSVGINAMILSLIYKLPPSECRMIMIDPKMLELSVYDGIPHLMTPVITDSKKAIIALKWAVAEMENRYKMMSSLGVRNIINYNIKVDVAIKSGTKLQRQVDVGYNRELGRMETETISFEPKKMPYIVLIVDEMADLMIVAGKEVESQVQRLAQMARAAGIHIIMATQRPSVDVITGVIKANFPSRISFQVTSKIDSRTILGEQGAEQLLGQGDMLFMQGAAKIQRIHGPFVSDGEVEKIVSYLKENNACEYVDIVHYDEGENSFADEKVDIEYSDELDGEDLYRKAIKIVKEDRRTSISYVQRKLRIGYNKAANLIEKMEQDGILSSPDKNGKRIIVDDLD